MDEGPSETGKKGLKKRLRRCLTCSSLPLHRAWIWCCIISGQLESRTAGGMTVGSSDVVRFVRGISSTPDVQERGFGRNVEGGDWGVIKDALEDIW